MHPSYWTVNEPTRRALLAAAKRHRKNPTRSEAILWQALRGNSLGLRVRRQQPVGPYIVDFYVAKKRLVIEVDGSSHDDNQDADDQRERNLETLGYRVLRVQASEVEDQLGDVLERISAELKSDSQSESKRKRSIPFPLQATRWRAEGELRTLRPGRGMGAGL